MGHQGIWVNQFNSAPEVLSSQHHGFAVDYWALGVILYEIMFGKRPYPGIVRKDYKERVMNTVVHIQSDEKPDDWSEDSRDLINNLIQRKEDLRLGSKGAIHIKNHPWFKDIEWEDMLSQKISAPFRPSNVIYFLIVFIDR